MRRLRLLISGLLTICAPGVAVAQQFHDCTEPGFLYNFDPRLPAQPCVEVMRTDIPWSGGAAKLRVVRPAAMPMNPEVGVLASNMRELARIVGAAMDRMGGLDIDNVTILFVNYVSPAEPPSGRDAGWDKGRVIAAASDPVGRECPVRYWKLPMATSEDNVIFTLAHELFHCIQFKTWPAMPWTGWLAEGGAEYFAHLAKEGHGPDFVGEFAARSPNTPLDQLDYPAVPFYFWMGGTSGPEAVGRFLGSTRSIASAVSPDMWLDFEKAYYDQNLHFPDGRAVPYEPQLPGTIRITGDEAISSQHFLPYTVRALPIRFARGKLYEMTYEPLPTDARMAWRNADGNAWLPPPTEIAACNADQDFLAAWGGASEGNTGRMRFRARDDDKNACACPVGVWRETAASSRRFFEQSALGVFGGGSKKRYVGGTRVLTLNSDHSGSFSYENVETITGEGSDFSVETVLSGTVTFTWSASNGVLTLPSGRIHLHSVARGGGRASIRDGETASQSFGHAFTCDGSGLHLTVSPSPGATPATGSFNVDADFAPAGAALRNP